LRRFARCAVADTAFLIKAQAAKNTKRPAANYGFFFFVLSCSQSAVSVKSGVSGGERCDLKRGSISWERRDGPRNIAQKWQSVGAMLRAPARRWKVHPAENRSGPGNRLPG